MNDTIKALYSHTDTGFCRVYYKVNKSLFCWQQEGPDGNPDSLVFNLCSSDGEPQEPMDNLSPNKVSFEHPGGQAQIERDLLQRLQIDGYQVFDTSEGYMAQPPAQGELILKGAYLSEADMPRLKTKARAIWDIMDDSEWYELNEIAEQLNMPHSSVTAAVRAFRYDENGAHTVKTRRIQDGKGTWEYQLVPNTPEGVANAKARAKSQPSGKGKSKAYRDGYRDALLAIHGQINKQATANSWWLDSTKAGADIVQMIEQAVVNNAPAKSAI